MSLVWTRAPYAGGKLLVLLALADWSDDEGRSWPGIEKLAAKARLKPRQTQYVIRELQRDGIINIKEGGGPANPHKYQINIPKLSGLTVQKVQGAKSDTYTLHSATSTVQSVQGSTVQSTAPDPSVDPSVDTSIDTSDLSRAAQVRAVFQFWQEHLNHPKAVLDGKRERSIEMRLKQGFTADDLILAIRGCKATPYNMGENKEQRVYDDIELICRDAKHVEEFITAAAPRGGASGTDAESDDERRRREECQQCLGTGMRLKDGKAMGRCNHE